MSLLLDNLSVWEIGHRWAGVDPAQVRLRLPLLVRDNFRTLIDAIYSAHLPCETLLTEKYDGSDPDEAKLYIRTWLNDVYACIESNNFRRKFLEWARVDRLAFKRWCDLRTIPLPDFWFPPGWALDFQFDEESLVTAQVEATNEVHGLSVDVCTGAPIRSEQSTPDGSDTDSEVDRSLASPKKLRENQRRTIAVQVVAANLWRKHPEMTIAAMVKHDAIQSLCGGEFQVPEVVQKWVRSVAPIDVKQRRGRPRSTKVAPDELR